MIGVSKDSVSSHQKFAEKNALPFVLLSDPELKAIKDYGVWQEKKLYGKVSEGVVRSVFVIGPDGRLLDAVYKPVFRRSAMKLPTHLSIPQSRLFVFLKSLHKISAFTVHSFLK